jgi:hypothetical protein
MKAATSQNIEDYLYEVISEYSLVDPGSDEMIVDVSTFEEQGVLTNNKGLVIKTADGSEFQVTIVRSRRGGSSEY